LWFFLFPLYFSFNHYFFIWLVKQILLVTTNNSTSSFLSPFYPNIFNKAVCFKQARKNKNVGFYSKRLTCHKTLNILKSILSLAKTKLKRFWFCSPFKWHVINVYNSLHSDWKHFSIIWKRGRGHTIQKNKKSRMNCRYKLFKDFFFTLMLLFKW
jgi:hypothetical protein